MFAWLEQGQTSAKFSVTLRLTCKKARVCFVFFFFDKVSLEITGRGYTSSTERASAFLFLINEKQYRISAKLYS